jgi:hypothetical protein
LHWVSSWISLTVSGLPMKRCWLNTATVWMHTWEVHGLKDCSVLSGELVSPASAFRRFIEDVINRNCETVSSAPKLTASWSFLQCKSSCIPAWSKNCKMHVHQIFVRYLWCHTFLLSSHLWWVPSRILQACHPSLKCSILFWQCMNLHCCKIVVWLQPFTLRNQPHSSHSRVWKTEERKNAKATKENKLYGLQSHYRCAAFLSVSFSAFILFVSFSPDSTPFSLLLVKTWACDMVYSLSFKPFWWLKNADLRADMHYILWRQL